MEEANIIRNKSNYVINGDKYDRVTDVLNYFTPQELVEWGLRVGKEEANGKKKLGKSTGTRVHNLIEEYIQKGRYKLTAYDTVAIKNCMTGFERWWQIEKPVVEWQDRTIWSEELGIAGTADIGIKGCLPDFKSSERISPTYWLQVAIYNHMLPVPYEKIGIVRFDKMTSEYEYKTLDFKVWGELLVNAYIGLLNYYRFYKSFDKEKGGIEIEEIKRGVFDVIPKEGWTEFHKQI